MKTITIQDNSLDLNKDHHSYANVDEIQVTHIDLSLNVDFTQKTLTGEAVLSLKYHIDHARELVLDTRNLTIQAVTDQSGQALNYTIGDEDEILGSALTITLPSSLDKLRIEYQTNPSAEGLQWMPPAATDGKKHPYLFSQSQPINTRSWIPLQDSPKARVTFAAEIKTPPELRAVMSAINNPERNADGIYRFTMNKPIPTHLLAIAVGDLHFQEVSTRSGVYTELGMLEKAAKEFEDVELMMQTAERLMGPYLWERFDMLVLPGSFPFGGMENPCLTFLTPTLIAGDKSLVSTVAHELAHSWTGNLVSNATWRDLWINEGFTTYFTIRIVEEVYNKELGLFQLVLEYQRMADAIKSTNENEQSICIDLQDKNPEDAFNAFSYVKGSMFVQFLEDRVGREDFDYFLKTYINHFAFQPITTEIIRDYIVEHLVMRHSEVLSPEEIDHWIYGPGLPESYPVPVSEDLNEVQKTISEWFNGKVALNKENTKHWICDHWIYFLGNLPKNISLKQAQQLDETFDLTNSQNSEIAFKWFLIVLNVNYEAAFPALKDFLTRIGRGKFVNPLYAKMNEDKRYKKLVKDIYQAARSGYHPSISKQLDKKLLN